MRQRTTLKIRITRQLVPCETKGTKVKPNHGNYGHKQVQWEYNIATMQGTQALLHVQQQSIKGATAICTLQSAAQYGAT